MELTARTDLATEVRESFSEDVEIKGVEIKTRKRSGLLISTVDIKTDEGAQVMGKPVGRYVSIESGNCLMMEDTDVKKLVVVLTEEIRKLCVLMGLGEKPESVLVAGIGNRNITSDSIGPKVIDSLDITRHMKLFFPDEHSGISYVSAIAPGVMAQTGMETGDIIRGVVDKLAPKLVIVIDALASRSMDRINATYQLTDTGISPGSGLGNQRHVLNKDSIGVPVLAIGVPTVVDATTIAIESIEKALEGIDDTKAMEKLVENLDFTKLQDKYVTTKNIDEEVICVSKILKEAINGVFAEKK
ncbi:MAG: GPR endopeptidase [Lachnospiraceae bacterium]|nr:GPR endopeptidase [Lachnospiraceae bacterium]